MEKYVIKGGNPLVGEVEIGGAKNAALAILAAATMTDDNVYIDNMPDASDTNAMLQAIASTGAIVERLGRHEVKINASQIHDFTIVNDHIKKIFIFTWINLPAIALFTSIGLIGLRESLFLFFVEEFS